jgi:selenocysteine-specific elongation factor
VNLQGEAKDEIHRGDLLTEPGALLSTSMFDASLHWMARKVSLDDSTSVELLCGTTERRAGVARIGKSPIAPGERAYARVHVSGPPLALLPGDRFVLRGFARDAGVGSTLGGGIVLDVAPPHRRRRDAGLLRDLERMASGESTDALDVRIARAGLQGTTIEMLRKETGLDTAAIDEAIDQLVDAGHVMRLDTSVCLSTRAAERLMENLLAALEAFHLDDPLQAGMPRAALTGTLPSNVTSEAGAILLKRLAAQGEISIKEEIVSREGFESSLDEAQSRLADSLRGRLAKAALDAPALRTLAEDLGEDLSIVRGLGHYLERQGALIAAPDELFFDRQSVLDLIERVVGHFDTNEELDTQTLKSLIGTSRRTAMPLMALLDDLQITRRDGSVRRLLRRGLE